MGAVGKMHFYPYPFYRPEFIWSIFSKGDVNYPLAYFLMFIVLMAGMLLFVGIGRLMMFINDKMISKTFCRGDECTVSEQSDADVWNLLLQILEDGVLTDAQGRRVDFRNTVLVMTSNVGAKAITSSAAKLGFAQAEDSDGGFAHVKETVMAELRATFKPEFLNRIDSTVVFRRLSRADVSGIARRMLKATVQRAAALGVTLTVEDAAVERIADEGFDPLYGARPLRRVIRAEVEDAVAELLLSGTLHAGDAARIAAEDGALRVRREEPSIPAAAET